MKLNTIKNAYIKNKPNYNYTITDEDGLLIATGHLLSARDKQKLSKMIQITIDQNGKTNTNINSPLQMSIQTILLSLDSWQLELPLNAQTIALLDESVIIWLTTQVNKYNFQSITSVEYNEKN